MYRHTHVKDVENVLILQGGVWVLEKYKAAPNMKKINEQIIIDNIIEELNKKRKIAITKKEEAILKDETWKYSEEEDVLDYILFLINEGTGKLC
jgi:hypothetical protein